MQNICELLLNSRDCLIPVALIFSGEINGNNSRTTAAVCLEKYLSNVTILQFL